MRAQFWFILLVVFWLVSALAACSAPTSGDAVTSAAPADFEGQIVEIYAMKTSEGASGLSGAMLVEGKLQGSTLTARVTVTAEEDTRLLQQDGQSYQPITFDSLAAGQRVRIKFRGPVAESDPMQATADEIVVTRQ